MDPYRIDDVEGAADAFPDMNFEIIHSGLAFTTETAWALARFPNVYANFEITSSLIVKAPRMFANVLGEFLMWGGPEKVVFSDGSMVFHSQPILERIATLELSDEVLETFGVEPWDHEQKRLFLGSDYARIIGLDLDEAKSKIENDEFSIGRREQGLAEPYSHWRAHLAAESELVQA